MSKIISVFNHKGGVGKTTFLYNLAFELSSRGKKVLMIDTDSQMNLTASVHGFSTNIENIAVDGSKWQNAIKNYLNLDEYLKIEGVMPMETNILQNKALFSRDLASEINNQPMFEEYKIKADIMGPGMGIIDTERKLHNFIGVEDRPYKFQQAIKKISANYDFTLIDTSLSAGSTMNGLLVLGSDYLIVPASPTFFSLMAVDNLEYIFQEWHSRLSSTTQYGFKMDVKFLGIFFQMAKKFEAGTKKVGDDERFSRYANHWITEINKSSVEFYKYASRKEWSIDKDKFGDIFKKRYDPFIIEKCCDFTGKLRGYSETFGVPILALNQIVNHKDLEKDIKMPQYQAALEQVKEVYKNTVDGLLKL